MRVASGLIRDGDAEALVSQVVASGQPTLAQRGVLAARAYIAERAAASPPGPEIGQVFDQTIPASGGGLPVRVYRSADGESLPTVVYFHGGGWVVGSVAASDAFCRRVVEATPCVLISVDYRLAPEHPFPAAVDDAVAAVDWAASNGAVHGGDPDRLMVLGDSAGGNLAAVAVGRLIAQGRNIVARQILAYPGVAAERIASSQGPGSQWPLTDDEMAWFRDQYVDEALRSHPDVAPLNATAAGLPPTTLLLGGCDPLMTEGMSYAEHLAMSGVSVDLHVYFGQIHGFLTMDPTILPRSREALGVVANAIRGVHV